MYKIIPIILSLLFWADSSFAAVVEGTSAGFVTVAPSADPTGAATSQLDTRVFASRFTSPAGATTITEIGWWCNNSTEAANFEVGVYDHNMGDGEPENLLAGASQTNAKGTTSGWKAATGLNITITESTIYWFAVQLDDTATATHTDYTGNGSNKMDFIDGQTTLPSPSYGTPNGTVARVYAIYAIYTTEVTAKPQLIMVYE